MNYIVWAVLLLLSCESELNIHKPDVPISTPNAPDLSPPTRHDQITQITTPEVDILWVIDDSCSMAEEQEKLTLNFPAFMHFILTAELDWHVGVVSTDMRDPSKSGKLQGSAGYLYLTPETPNPIAVFSQMATLGISGTGFETGRFAAFSSLTDPLLSRYNAGFYRDEASLHIIVISDEEDSSANNPTRNEFITFLQGMKEDPTMVTFSSIVGPLGGCPTAQQGAEYIAVTEAVGGIHDSICNSEWSPILEALGLQAAGLRHEYFLSEIPVPDTLDVWVEDDPYRYVGTQIEGGCAQSSCFHYEYIEQRNSIVLLDYTPQPNATVHIEYDLMSGHQPLE